MNSQKSGDELFIVDNSDADYKAGDYLREWTEYARAMDIATGYFEIGALLSLNDEWQKLEKIRILMGDEVTARTRKALLEGVLRRAEETLDASLEKEKESNDFLVGVPAIVDAMANKKIECRVYSKKKFHAKAYITHAKGRVIGSSALVGSSNFTYPGLWDNIELNVQLRREVDALQAWYETHWDEGEDVSEELLKIIQRHTAEYSPFEIYARALRELMRHHIPDVEEWVKNESKIFPLLAKYQQDGYASLMQIADTFGGAFLCDGVGLGKTFVGMMVIERLLHDRKKVVLIAPKATVAPVWEATLRQKLPSSLSKWSGLHRVAHTDLGRTGAMDGGGTWEEFWNDVEQNADAIVIDEAHHFRNPGTFGGQGKRESRYRSLARVAGPKPDGSRKQLFLLTATPVNNSLRDFQHMIELFTGNEGNYFASKLGIHSLPTHFGELEKKLDKEVRGVVSPQAALPLDVNEVEAEEVLRDDAIFSSLVVQRSRAYARQSQLQEAEAKGQSGDHLKIFPDREAPRVAEYSIKKTYGKLLQKVEDAFNKEKPLFALAIYYPLAYAKDEEKERLIAEDRRTENQQQQVVGLIRTNFLKRFESSTCSFEVSCSRLLLKILRWIETYVETEAEKKRLDRWRRDNALVLNYVAQVLPGEFENKAEDKAEADEKTDEDDATPDMADENIALEFPRKDYKVDEILEDCFNDLHQIAEFLNELRKFKPSNDDKLRRLIELLKKELKDKKVLIFTQFSDTAKYLQTQLREAGIEGVDKIDSSDKRDRGEVIRAFAPYYNGTSLPELKARGIAETRVLISTDVLSEGLNLQDATRLINYDLHWNPVRLMQRIGRVDRRMNPETEARIVQDNPRLFAERGDNNTVAYWNFLPPEELNELLSLYKRVTHKTLRISKTFGIEGKKLLTPDDDFDALKDFTHVLEGDRSPLEELSLEWQNLQNADEALVAKLDALPGRVFSGKAHPQAGSRAVFFCYVLPIKNKKGEWTHDGGQVLWLLHDIATGKVLDSPPQIADFIRSNSSTPRRTSGETQTLSEIRKRIEAELRNSHLKSLQPPAGVKPILKCWMELL
jgi:SNF2 family DNA or RNA helicase